MRNKNYIIIGFLLIILSYIAYKIIAFMVLDSKITFDNKVPEIKFGQFVTISENRIKYVHSFYIDKDFNGFSAFVDDKYFVTITKLGRVSKGFKITKTGKKPINSSDINLMEPSNVADENARYIDLHNYPYKIKELYYHSDDTVININQSQFYEVESVFSFFNISFKNETSKDFGFAGSKKRKSISFLEYNDELFIINLFPIGQNPYRSLHNLLDKNKNL